jgi:hypothetical protein
MGAPIVWICISRTLLPWASRSNGSIPLLPEPVATDDAADRNLYLKDILSYSLMVLLEKLNATERAVFILKESFDYTHQEIAQVLSITEDHSRKLLSRAKAKLFKPGLGANDRDVHTSVLLERYMDAIRRRDTLQLTVDVAILIKKPSAIQKAFFDRFH